MQKWNNGFCYNTIQIVQEFCVSKCSIQQICRHKQYHSCSTIHIPCTLLIHQSSRNLLLSILILWRYSLFVRCSKDCSTCTEPRNDRRHYIDNLTTYEMNTINAFLCRKIFLFPLITYICEVCPAWWWHKTKYHRGNQSKYQDFIPAK